MGIKLDIFYLYKFVSAKNKERHILIRCTRENFQNYSQTKEDYVTREVESRKDMLLENYITQILGTTREHIRMEFLGEMQVDTFGEELYALKNKELTIYVADTTYEFPWIAIGQADSKLDFIQKMNNDELYDTAVGIVSLNPIVETLRELKVELITDASIA